MGQVADQFTLAFRDFVIDGNPASGPNNVDKAEVRAIGPLVEALVPNRRDAVSGNLILGSANSGSLLNNNAAGAHNGDANTGFGLGVFINATSAYASSAFGYVALNKVTTGHSNTAIGYQAGNLLTTGIMNTLVGVDAMYQATGANYNTVVGHHCMNSGVFTGDGAVVIGQQTARNLTGGNYIIAIGRNAMANSPATGSQNSVVIGGAAAIAASVDASVVVGYAAVSIAATLTNSVIIGKYAQYGGGTLNANTLVGVDTLFRSTGGGGDNNTTLGYQTGYSIEGTGNTLVGYRAGYLSSNTTVNSAVCIGNLAGFGMVTSSALYIGNSNAISAHLIWGNFASQTLKLRSNHLEFVDLPQAANDAAAASAGVAVGEYYLATGDNKLTRRAA